MARQVVLFAGLHKTGTTSIQETCARNERALLSAGFLYPTFIANGHRTVNHTGAFHFMFRKVPAKMGYSREKSLGGSSAGATAFGDRIKEAVSSRLLAGSTNLVVVAEGVSLLSIDELRAMKSWFGKRGWDVRVIGYVRWLSGWVSSMVSQRVTGFQHLTIKAATAEFLEASGLVRTRVTNLRDVFPDAEFYSYEAAAKHRHGLVGFFFETIGLRQMKDVTFVRANEGRSDCATRLMSSINEAFGPGLAGGAVNRRYADHDVRRLNSIPGPKFSLRRDEISPLLPLLVAENEWLKETLGEQFYDRHLEFGNEPCIWTEEGLACLREILGTATPAVRSLVASHRATLACADRAGRTVEGCQP